jgi:hypothetical protein
MNLLRHIFPVLCASMLLVSCAEEDPIEPETDPKDKFIGTWNVKEEIAGQVTGNYPSVVTSDTSNTSKIVIGNIYNLGTAVKIKALVVNNSLDISLQTITGVSIVGTGTYSGSGYILNYTADDGSGAQTVKATYTK